MLEGSKSIAELAFDGKEEYVAIDAVGLGTYREFLLIVSIFSVK